MECALFDLDHCLIAYSAELRSFELPTDNLTSVQIEGFPLNHYFINLAIIAQIFKELQKKEIIIGFITAATCYSHTVMKKFFEQVLDLEPDSLKAAPFISGKDFGGPFALKGNKIIAAKQHAILPKDCKVTLIDDDVLQIHSVRRLEDDTLEAVIAHGLPNRLHIVCDVDIPIDNRYLQDIIDKWDLNIKLPDDLVRSPKSLYTPLLQARIQFSEQQRASILQVEEEQQSSDAVECFLCCLKAFFGCRA